MITFKNPLRERLLRLIRRREHYALRHVPDDMVLAWTAQSIQPRTQQVLLGFVYCDAESRPWPEVWIHTIWSRPVLFWAWVDNNLKPVMGDWTADHHQFFRKDEFNEHIFLTMKVPGRFPNEPAQRTHQEKMWLATATRRPH